MSAAKDQKRPSWDLLYETAAGQAGHFTTAQAAEAGYSVALLNKHIAAGRIWRMRRGVYRLVHFPVTEFEGLVVVWLWSEMQGVFSHRTGLIMHLLSDILPSGVDITLPESWRQRRLCPPHGVSLYFADIPEHEREWLGPVPVTTVARTLHDAEIGGVAPDLLEQAIAQAGVGAP